MRIILENWPVRGIDDHGHTGFIAPDVPFPDKSQWLRETRSYNCLKKFQWVSCFIALFTSGFRHCRSRAPRPARPREPAAPVAVPQAAPAAAADPADLRPQGQDAAFVF
jgi:hypothetical protein